MKPPTTTTTPPNCDAALQAYRRELASILRAVESCGTVEDAADTGQAIGVRASRAMAVWRTARLLRALRGEWPDVDALIAHVTSRSLPPMVSVRHRGEAKNQVEAHDLTRGM